MHRRPSSKELNSRLRKAREVVSSGPRLVVIIDTLKWDLDWERLRRELGLTGDDAALIGDRLAIVQNCLIEIGPEDHLWRGRRMYCNRPGFDQVELWEFKWVSQVWPGKELYIKFGFKGERLCFLSFHPDEPSRSVVRSSGGRGS